MARKPRLEDDDDYEDEITITEGHVDSDVKGDSDKPCAVLWIPDCEQRKGWREYYVWKEEKAQKRRFGFVK